MRLSGREDGNMENRKETDMMNDEKLEQVTGGKEVTDGYERVLTPQYCSYYRKMFIIKTATDKKYYMAHVSKCQKEHSTSNS